MAWLIFYALAMFTSPRIGSSQGACPDLIGTFCLHLQDSNSSSGFPTGLSRRAQVIFFDDVHPHKALTSVQVARGRTNLVVESRFLFTHAYPVF